MVGQTQSGKSMEYAIAFAIHLITKAPIIENQSSKLAKAAYESIDGQRKSALDCAAANVANFLNRNDSNFKNIQKVFLQPDSKGQIGDVRDVVFETSKGELGISAKNNHNGVKHSRLSDNIDFGQEWAGCPVGSNYFKQIEPIFRRLRLQSKNGMNFNEIENKELTVYLPVLTAFEDELKALCMDYGRKLASGLFVYLLGKQDYYKVVKQDSNQTVSILSINLRGKLGWGNRFRIPNYIEYIKRKPNKNNTLIVSFADGWQFSFRLHSATKKVEPSLKFDINILSLPVKVSKHDIPFG